MVRPRNGFFLKWGFLQRKEIEILDGSRCKNILTIKWCIGGKSWLINFYIKTIWYIVRTLVFFCGGCYFFFLSITFDPFLAKSVEIRGIFILSLKATRKCFTIALALLNERLDQQCLLSGPSKIINYSDILNFLFLFYKA